MVDLRPIQIDELVPHWLERHAPLWVWFARTHEGRHDLKVARFHGSFVLLVECDADN